MIYPIVLYGDPVLKQKAKEVPEDYDVNQFVEDMYETMYAAGGVGLAAPQVGKSLRVFVIDSSPMEEDENGEGQGLKEAFINPEIVEEEGKAWAFEEGCLSIPGIREDVTRLGTITINYLNQELEEKEETFSGIRARIIQHEYDHIEGKLFTEYLSPLKKRLLKGRLANISKGKVDADYRVKAPLKK